MSHFRLLISAAILAIASSAVAQEIEAPRLAAVNVSYIARTSVFGKTTLSKIEDEAQRRQTEIAARAADLQKQQLELQQTGVGLTERARLDLQRAFDRARVDFDRFREDTQRDLQGLQAQFEADFKLKVAPVIEEIAKEKGYQFVFNADDNPLIAWLSKTADISDEVVKRLDAAGKR